MTNLVVAAPAEPQRSLAAGLKRVADFWRSAAAGQPTYMLDDLNDYQIRDLGLNAEQRMSAVGPRLWSNWFNAPRHPFGI